MYICSMNTLEYYLTLEGKRELYSLRAAFVTYCITNSINGKKYIGISSKVRQRLKQHSKAFANGSKQYIHKAMHHYGLANFTFEILEVLESRGEMNQAEIKYISKYNTTDLSKGYNLTYGGNSSSSTPETYKNKVKASKKVKVGQYSLKGDLIKIFESVMAASRELDIPDTDIHRCCKRRWSRKQFMFSKCLSQKIKPYVSNKGKNLIGLEPTNKIKTKLLNKTTGEVFEGESIKDACKKASIDTTTFYRIKNKPDKENRKWKIIL